MTLPWNGKIVNRHLARTMPLPSVKLVVLVHGLCMSDVHWHSVTQREDQGPPHVVDHGQALAAALGYTPIYLRYNSGLHTSQNGRELAARLEQLVTDWPLPIEELTLVGYSMGGLVTRSACHYGRQSDIRWPGPLKNAVFLATPHHGAPLERAGNWLDVVLGSTPYSAPYGRLIKLRSAGITDLRYGHVLDEDWVGHDRFRRAPDRRRHVPLPEGGQFSALAATRAAKRSPLADRLVGDGLVPLPSALGLHDDAHRTLGFAKATQTVVYKMGHIEVPRRAEVTRQLIDWLTPA